MANQGGFDKNFSKLKIDTGLRNKHTASPFAAFEKRTNCKDDRDTQSKENDSAWKATKEQGKPSAGVNDDDLGVSDWDLGHATTENRRARRKLKEEEIESADSGGRSFPSGSQASTENAKGRRRGPTIKFDGEVSLDSGVRQPAGAPLPRKPSPGTSGIPNEEDKHADGLSQHDRSYSDSDQARYDPVTGKPLYRPNHEPGKFHTGEPIYPLQQSTIDEFALFSPSSTNGTTPSSILEEELTSIKSNPEYTGSTPNITSPQSAPWPTSSFGRRRDTSRSVSSLRSSMYSSVGSTGRKERRRQSYNSATSPAASFLSGWSRRNSTNQKVPDPDDEGQEIGDKSGYIIGRQIGFGGFSVIKEVSTMEDGQEIKRAVKIVRKVVSGSNEADNERIQAELECEVKIWRLLYHPHVLPLLTVFESDFATFCIMHLNTGGTLFDLVRDTRKGSTASVSTPGLGPSPKSSAFPASTSRQGLPSSLAKRYLFQVASALRYLHEDVRIVHRDIKLENCLLDTSCPDGGKILLCDFGMADFIMSEERERADTHSNSNPEPDGNVGPAPTSTTYTFGGSLPYAAPEAVEANMPIYEPSIDVWAYGVLTYVLLTGEFPFSSPFEPKLIMSILKGVWDEEVVKQRVEGAEEGEKALELLKGCLRKDVGRRWTVGDILGCRLLEGFFEEEN